MFEEFYVVGFQSYYDFRSRKRNEANSRLTIEQSSITAGLWSICAYHGVTNKIVDTIISGEGMYELFTSYDCNFILTG